MESKIIDSLNKLEWFITDKADINIGDYQEIIKHTIAIRNDVLNMRKVNSTLQVLEIEEQLTKITKEIHILEDSYINADECGDISAKKYIGSELKRLRKERENL